MAAANGTCPKAMKATSNGAWQGDTPFDFSLPLLAMQIIVVLVVTRSLAWALRPLRQPRVIAEIVGGILLGPSALGRNKAFLNKLFPARSMTVLDSVANVGLIFYLFLVGLELDHRAIRQTGRKAFAVAAAGISVPFILGIGTSFVLHKTVVPDTRLAAFIVFMGVAYSITAIAIPPRILAELKLINTEMGRITVSAAVVNDISAWILLALGIALSGTRSPVVTVWVLLTALAYATVAVVALRRILTFMARKCSEGEPVREAYVCFALATVLASALITDTIGIHPLFGGFLIGAIVPKDGPFAGALIEKTEDFITSLFLPLYFVASGLKTNVATISGASSWALLVLVIATSAFGKVAGTVAAAWKVHIPLREAFTIGFLMNCKGLVELIVLNIGRDLNVLNDETFAIMVLMALFNTFLAMPAVVAIYKPKCRGAAYQHRTIEGHDVSTDKAELRLMACFHSSRSIPSIINLIESSRGTRRAVTVYAMHLMELSERPSAIVMVNKAQKNGLPFWNINKLLPYGGAGGEPNVVVAFEAYQQLSRVAVRPMMAISDLSTIHEDISASAQTKRATFIVIPFHKHQRVDGSMESLGRAYQQINQNVLRHAPCSVGILVDRGLGGVTQVFASEVSYTIAALFFGGADDREVLAYAARMAEHPGIALVVLRFVHDHGDSSVLEINGEQDDDKMLQSKVLAANPKIHVEDRPIATKSNIVDAIKDVSRQCNLILVGRTTSLVTTPLVERTDTPELGLVGSYLASSEFAGKASVLVVQQYDSTRGDTETPCEDVPEVQYVPDTPNEYVGGRVDLH